MTGNTGAVPQLAAVDNRPLHGGGDASVLMESPKVAPDCIARTAIEEWLDRQPSVSLRLIAAASGSGKTTAVARWARARRDRVAWITVPAGATRSELCALVLCALASAETSSLAHALRSTTKTQLVFDGADRADFDGRAFLSGLAGEAPDAFGFVFLARAKSALDIRPGAQIAVLEASALAFDADDVERLCVAHKLTTTALERQRFVAQTGGWALAVAGTIRYAAAMGGTLESAFERWFAGSRGFLERLVNDALALAEPSLAAVFTDLLRDADSPNGFAMPVLADEGLFVEVDERGCRINPVVAMLRPAPGPEERRPPAIVHLFGRFRFAVNDREVTFSRRRDRQIVQYLALQRDGTATRSELLAVFWPNTEPAAAARALRSACTTIRRSLADCVGRDDVSAYFQAEGAMIRLCADHVFSTAQRFSKHVDLALEAERRSELDAAFAHWSAARGLHTTALLAGEPSTWWIAERQSELHRLATIAAQRVQALRYVAQVQTGTSLSA